jgi:hypothetical protein
MGQSPNLGDQYSVKKSHFLGASYLEVCILLRKERRAADHVYKISHLTPNLPFTFGILLTLICIDTVGFDEVFQFCQSSSSAYNTADSLTDPCDEIAIEAGVGSFCQRWRESAEYKLLGLGGFHA